MAPEPYQDTNLGGASETRSGGFDPTGAPPQPDSPSEVRSKKYFDAEKPDLTLSYQDTAPAGSALSLLNRGVNVLKAPQTIQSAMLLQNDINSSSADVMEYEHTNDLASTKEAVRMHKESEDYLTNMAAAAEGIMVDLAAMEVPQQQTGIDPTLGESIAGLAAILGGGGRRAAEDLVEIVKERQKTEFENQMAEFQFAHQNKQLELSMAQQAQQFAQQMVHQAKGHVNQAALQDDAQAHQTTEGIRSDDRADTRQEKQITSSEKIASEGITSREKLAKAEIAVRKQLNEDNNLAASQRQEAGFDAEKDKAVWGSIIQNLNLGMVPPEELPGVLEDLKKIHKIDLTENSQVYLDAWQTAQKAKERSDREFEMKEEAHQADVAYKQALASKARAGTGPGSRLTGEAGTWFDPKVLRDPNQVPTAGLGMVIGLDMIEAKQLWETDDDVSPKIKEVAGIQADIRAAGALLAKLEGKSEGGDKVTADDKNALLLGGSSSGKTPEEVRQEIKGLREKQRVVLGQIRGEFPDVYRRAVSSAVNMDEYVRRWTAANPKADPVKKREFREKWYERWNDTFVGWGKNPVEFLKAMERHIYDDYTPKSMRA